MRLDFERLLDIIEAIEAIERRKPPTKTAFDQDELVQVWFLRHLEILGEAASKLSDDTRGKAPDIPWKKIIGMRNALIHAYFGIDWNEIWNVVVNDINPLKNRIKTLLQKIEKDEQR
jgi:uncharacterized protein with HEPN domain